MVSDRSRFPSLPLMTDNFSYIATTPLPAVVSHDASPPATEDARLARRTAGSVTFAAAKPGDGKELSLSMFIYI